MSKFIIIKDYDEFDKIKEYIGKNPDNNYYFAPNLMSDYLSDLRHLCVIGLTIDDIKVNKRSKIDLLAIPVYNRLFERNAFRVEAIKDEYSLKKLNHGLELDSIVFGIRDDVRDFRHINYFEEL